MYSYQSIEVSLGFFSRLRCVQIVRFDVHDEKRFMPPDINAMKFLETNHIGVEMESQTENELPMER